MAITPETPLPRPTRTPQAAAPLRRRTVQPAPRAPIWRRALNFLLLFATLVLLTDGLVGEKGLVETMRARRLWQGLEFSVEQLRQENARLREQVRRLNEDATTIESVARQELGLIRPGEVLVILKDIKPASPAIKE
jgi:cell division protein FtsB